MKKILVLGLFLILGLGLVKAQVSCDGCISGQRLVRSMAQGSTTTLTTDTSTTPMWYTFMTDSSIIIFNFSGSFTLPIGMTGRLMMIPQGRTVVMLSHRIAANDSCTVTATPDPNGISGVYCWDSLAETMTSVSTTFVFEQNNWDLDSMEIWFIPRCPAVQVDTFRPSLQIAKDSLVYMKSVLGLPEQILAIECARLVHKYVARGLLRYNSNLSLTNTISWSTAVARVDTAETVTCGDASLLTTLLCKEVLDSTCAYMVSMGNITDSNDVRGHVMVLFIAPTDTGNIWILTDPLVGTCLRKNNGVVLDYRTYLYDAFAYSSGNVSNVSLKSFDTSSLYRQDDTCLHEGRYVFRNASVHPFHNSYMVRGMIHSSMFFDEQYDTLLAINMAYWGFSGPSAHMPADTSKIPMGLRNIYWQPFPQSGCQCQPSDTVLRELFGRIEDGILLFPLFSPEGDAIGEEPDQYKSTLSVWPNPTTGMVNVHATQYQLQGEIRLQISDILGHVVFKDSQKDEYSSSIDMSSYSKGIYLVTATYPNGSRLTKKLLLQ